MERDGARTNHGQFIPYPSKEMKDHESIYVRLKVIFDEVFEWISSEVSLLCLRAFNDTFLTSCW